METRTLKKEYNHQSSSIPQYRAGTQKENPLVQDAPYLSFQLLPRIFQQLNNSGYYLVFFCQGKITVISFKRKKKILYVSRDKLVAWLGSEEDHALCNFQQSKSYFTSSDDAQSILNTLSSIPFFPPLVPRFSP